MKTESRERLIKILFYATILVIFILVLYFGWGIITKWGKDLIMGLNIIVMGVKKL